MPEEYRDPWLVAVWPGMGNVALAAGTYLVEKLGATRIAELPAAGFFDVDKIDVRRGVARPGRLPGCFFYGWRNPDRKRDLLVFVGEAQPPSRGIEFCQRVIKTAQGFGVTRVFTFAAMATPIHPSTEPRVFSVATSRDLLGEVEGEGVEILEEGQISGLNGVLLAAAAENGLGGVCLLGELPYFAVGVPNPKASQAVLKVFTRLSGIALDFAEISAQAAAVDRGLVELLDRLNKGGRKVETNEPSESDEPAFPPPPFGAEPAEEESDEKAPKVPAEARRHIEQLFERARKDRRRALDLKQELDRLGIFKEYEDRFLDLFKAAE